MEFLYVLEELRTPALDVFFSVITYLGSELVFLVLSVVMYWCVSKSEGMYLLSVGCLGTSVNQLLKLACRIPRPWVRDPGFTIVESARAEATGYSFPSGHTQNAIGTFGCLAMAAKKPALRWIFPLLAMLTAFSRMYLGVHTPSDVIVSAFIAIAMVFGLRPLFRNMDTKPQKGFWILLGLSLVNGFYVLYANLRQFPADIDPVNLEHGIENAAKLMGALLGMTAGYAVDLKWVRFDTKASFPAQILKVGLGLLILLGIKAGLKPILGPGSLSDALRYGLMTFFAGGLWPMTFRFFAKL